MDGIKHEIADDRSGDGVTLLVLIRQLLHNGLPFALVLEDNQEVTLVGEIQLESSPD